MRILVTAAWIAIGLASPAAAETWRASSSTDEAAGFIDVESIRREGDRASFWREIRWPEVRSMSDGRRYDRIAAHYEADCRGRTLQLTAFRTKLGAEVVLSHDGRGEVEAVTPGTAADTDLRAACFDEWPRGG